MSIVCIILFLVWDLPYSDTELARMKTIDINESIATWVPTPSSLHNTLTAPKDLSSSAAFGCWLIRIKYNRRVLSKLLGVVQLLVRFSLSSEDTTKSRTVWLVPIESMAEIPSLSTARAMITSTTNRDGLFVFSSSCRTGQIFKS